MSDTPHISVIIPVYNTAPYLRRCLDSVCGQTLENIEIICVNDGSSDESDAILKEYAARDSRVLPITFGRNLGVSSARNVGIAAACGEWLGFVDSDDSVEPDFYEKLYVESRSGTAEIVKGACWSERDAPNYINLKFNEQIRNNKLNFIYQWTTSIYNAKFIKKNNIYFLQNCSRGEDIAFLYNAILCSTNIKVIDDAIYNYFYRENSNNSYILSYKNFYDSSLARRNMIDNLNKYINKNDIYINEYKKLMLIYIMLPYRAMYNERNQIANYAIQTIFLFIEKCRLPSILLYELKKQDPELVSMIYSHNIEGLQSYIQLTPMQRLRIKSKAKLKNTLKNIK